MLRIFCFVISWCLIAFAQPDLSGFVSILGAACGYGFFWYSLEPLKKPSLPLRTLFVSCFFWIFTIEGIHFSWMLSDQYIGKLIYLVWLTLITILSVLFSGFSCLLVAIVRQKRTAFLWSLPGVWVAIEMLRFYGIFSGMSFDYLGWPMTASAYGRQFGGFLGWAGQSFAVIAVNMSFYCLLLKKPHAKMLWVLTLLLPYTFGAIHYEYLKHAFQQDKRALRVAVVQPAHPPIRPKLKSPIVVWEQLLQLVSPIQQPIDLLIFPEVVVPFGKHRQVYPYESCAHLLSSFAPLPEGKAFLSNSDCATALSQHFQCPVIIGLERWVKKENVLYWYNSAEVISHKGISVGYDKRILVPGGEYIPGGKFGSLICRQLFPKYALGCKRLPGRRSGVVQVRGLPRIGITICYEETFGYRLQSYKRQGAELLVNLTNDGWYPESRLPKVHFLHGMLRNQEFGMPCVRACQTGVTAAVDSLGRILKILPYDTRETKAPSGVLETSLPLFNYKTLYGYCGDYPMILIAFCAVSYLGGGFLGYRLLAKKEIR
ncbi:apolipoprotein N-acyltransferase [Chlamydia pneumoniae TW-183]|uniref:Apolipoprotein N-acyltransferase n=2 Tax=Chlamydia pneumoniae TaxID=83558 RepID=LNT_CHLPN|nr:apolipoprotein N-acyltransferase [Chlamydia pneumoniae]Q9Z7Q1.1 RecName: Full=Apolipoprotein N-acyltransferase; Short=ALP N-acyltransferase [Chlamydia pneumoniae]AAD18792.1 Apolipoprotein N-Acetyltransferase [Chlamydia pneumoniae CWL029]AAF37978.1 apolipoprotein N-acyltransferase, putative [Chlamydia pneumoniae AR39]AAP98608.1 apolipoprotein N-acyltransferase [Chlamydia pneumoniae TW-183]CRI33170.1 Apolipoprotein N-acyltransferase [Chlamydia pneumoniae]CRI37160.1 Apolipoprotein N-acyltrans